jgi:hypothetical protein
MSEARRIHRELTPVWPRRVAGQRLWSLDAAFGDGLTLHDVTSGPDPHEVLFGALPDDSRIAAVLAQLKPPERAVAMAWADSEVTSWAEVAADAIALAPDRFSGFAPEALGERVRRKLKRLGAEHKRLQAQLSGVRLAEGGARHESHLAYPAGVPR